MTNKKILHFVWLDKERFERNELGSDYELPETVQASIDTYKRLHPGRLIKVWKNNDIYGLIINLPYDIYEKVNDKETTLVQVTDIIRAAALYKYGGIYCDCDTICIKPFDDLLKYDFFGAEERCKNETHMHATHSVCGYMRYLTNAFIGSIPNHPILDVYFKDLLKTENKLRISYGPKLLEQAMFNYFKSNKDAQDSKIFITPYDYFYVVPYYDNKFSNLKLTKNTYAIHVYSDTQ